MQLKVCGLKYFENIEGVIQLEVDYVGFIFHKESPRFVNGSISFDEARQIPKSIKKVGVFVNENTYSILDKVAHYDLDYVQLHGNESPKQCLELKPFVDIIKAFGINYEFDFKKLNEFEPYVNYFLFDSFSEQNGGSGKIFDWKMLDHYKLNIPFFLSGGISLENCEEVKKLKHSQLIGVDINSKLETESGIKDVSKINQFINKIKNGKQI